MLSLVDDLNLWGFVISAVTFAVLVISLWRARGERRLFRFDVDTGGTIQRGDGPWRRVRITNMASVDVLNGHIIFSKGIDMPRTQILGDPTDLEPPIVWRAGQTLAFPVRGPHVDGGWIAITFKAMVDPGHVRLHWEAMHPSSPRAREQGEQERRELTPWRHPWRFPAWFWYRARRPRYLGPGGRSSLRLRIGSEERLVRALHAIYR